MRGRKRVALLALALLAVAGLGLLVLGVGGSRDDPNGIAGKAGAATGGLGSLSTSLQGVASQAMAKGNRVFRVRSARGRLSSQGGGLTSVFRTSGAQVASGGSGMTFALTGVGYGRNLTVPASAAAEAKANEVSYRRGGVTEWYRNGPAGLEQGVTLTRPPARGTARGPLTVRVRVSGPLKARLVKSQVVFARSAGGTALLRYGGLSARDAGGRALPTTLRLENGAVLLAVDDRDARYPLTIDPLIQQGSKLTGNTSETGAGRFGVSAALSADGNTALVGGSFDSSSVGAAWVFTRSGGVWTQQGGKLTGSGGTGSGNFGTSVALSADGSTALIGAPADAAQVGAVWVFTRTGVVWTQVGSKLTGTGETGAGQFGGSVALAGDGNTALIGGGGDNAIVGAAWVFTRSGSVWSQEGPKLTATGETGAGRLGQAVALSSDGNTALVSGAADATNVGAAWVFTRSGGTWSQQGSKLTGGGATGASFFGVSVALTGDGNTALIGGKDDNAGVGAAWVFTRSGGTWGQQGSKLTGSGVVGTGSFGYSVALSADGTTALIGGFSDSSSVGAAWVFTRSGVTWSQQGSKLTAAGEIGAGKFGGSVGLSTDGSVALIGGLADNAFVGAAWIFTGSAGTWTQQGSKLTAAGGEIGAGQFGASVDVSDDGNTAIIGGSADNAGVGAAWVFTRSGGTWTQQGPKLTGTGEVGAGNFGFLVALSGDGSTALVGGFADSSNTGAAWVFTRSGGTWTQQGSKLTGTGEIGAGQFGVGVALSVDGNTALVGGYQDNSNTGAAWVFTRSGSTWTQQGSKFTGAGAGTGNPKFGYSVALSADGNTALSGGFSDQLGVGAAWVFTRSGGVWSQQGSKLTGTGVTANAQFGVGVALSADGSTAMVGGFNDTPGVGAAWVFTRAGSTWTQQGPKIKGTGEVGSGYFGWSVALSGDGNTALVGGYADSSSVGAAWVFTRSGGVWSQQGSKLTGTGEVGAGQFGFGVALSADGGTALIGGSTDTSSVGAAWVFSITPTTTALASAPNPSLVGGPLTFTATVAPTPDGGTVAFKDAGAAISGCGAQTVNTSSGLATCTPPAYAAAGTHSITADYSGSGNFGASSAAAITQTVSKAATFTVVTSSPSSPSVVGQAVTYTATVSPSPGSGTVAFADNGSPIAGCSALAVNASTGVAACPAAAYAASGSHAIVATYAGNAAFDVSTSSARTQTVNAASTATALTSLPNPSKVGDAVMYTATVSPAPDGGTVGFTDNGSTVSGCSAQPVNTTTGVATCGAAGHASAGMYSIVATYSGGANYGASTSVAHTQTVNKATTAAALGAAPNPSVVGADVTFTVTLPAGATGPVTFKDGATTISACSSAVASAGSATCHATFSAAGDHPISAVYAGDDNYVGSTSATVTQVVGKAGTATGLASSGTPSTVGQAVIYTATVGPVPDGGTVDFVDGGSSIIGCGAVAVTGGVATCTAPAYATAATHPVHAVYAGTANFVGSTSGTLSQVVAPASSTATLTVTANPSLVDQAVTFTVTLPPAATGNVLFKDGAATIGGCGARPAASGSATCPVAFTTAGAHSITATYAGDANYNGSTSAPLAQNVNRATPTATLASSQEPSLAGQQVTFTATLPAGTTGAVVFQDGASLLGACGAQPIVAGRATCQVAFAATGAHPITATYAGDANYAGSTSAVLTQTVNLAVTATTLGSSVHPSAVGQPVTYTATVSPLPDGGTVDFRSGLASIPGCAAVPVDTGSGTASCRPLAYATAGDREIVAVYSGNANNATSTSATWTQTVQPAGSGALLSSPKNPSVVDEHVTFSVTLPAGATGTILFTEGSTTMLGCAARPIDAGVATCDVAFPAAGPRTITAQYAGDANYTGSTSSVTQTVNRAPTVPLLDSAPNASKVGENVTFTLTLPQAAGGTVEVKDAGVTLTGCGSVTVSGGGASCVTHFTAVGAHAITADYTGDPNYEGSSSAPLTQNVDRAATATVLGSSMNFSLVGDAVTYTANVTPFPDGGTVAFSDGGTAIDGCDARPVNGSGVASCTPPAYATAGSRSIDAVFSGNANYVGSTAGTLTQVVRPTASGAALTSSDNPSLVDQTVTFTVVLPPAATGTVVFKDGTSAIGACASVPVSAGRATCELTFRTSGPRDISAVYAGDDNYDPSTSATITQTVNRAPTTITIATPDDPSPVDGLVTFTATLPSAATGTVEFKDGTTTLAGCTVAPAAGSATCTARFASVGAHSITAEYSGDGDYAGSTSAVLTQNVTPATVSAAVESSLNPSHAGEQVTFTLSLPSAATGTVEFREGGFAIIGCESAPVGAGAATCQTTYPTVGDRAISAVYSGDANHLGVTTAELTQRVDQAGIRAVVDATPNPSLVGGQVTLTATLPAVVTGTVEFRDGASAIPGCESRVLVSGIATCSLAFTTAGDHELTAAYSGDADHAGSTSLALAQTVGRAATSATLVTSANPALLRQNVTFTVTLPAGATGPVAFKDGADTIAVCAAQPAADGSATCQMSFITAGTRAVTAVYAGDANYTGSTSPAVTQVVDPAETDTALSSSARHAVVGQQVAYTATVTPHPYGGTVDFVDGFASIPGCGAVPVDPGTGVAVCPALGYPTIGDRQIVATYSGDADHLGSTSATLTQEVGTASATVLLGSSANPSLVGQDVTYTATMPPGLGGGRVTFHDGDLAVEGCGNEPVAGGRAQCAIAGGYGAAGAHAITALYHDDPDHADATSATLTQVVRDATSTTLSSSGASSATGEQVTYTATVSPVPVSGSVAFTENGVVVAGCGSVPFESGTGTASCSITYREAGSHRTVATYSGDGGSAGSTSPTVLQSVAAAPPGPPAVSTRVGPDAATLMLACSKTKLAVTSVLLPPTRSPRVSITGVAATSLAGKRASVYLSGARKALGSVVVPANGIFRVSVKAPSAGSRARARARYSVRIGKLRSSAQPLKRRLIMNALIAKAGRVTISGQAITPLTKPASKVLIQQRTACGRLVTVTSVKPSSNGRFRVTLTAPATARAAVYTATTRVRSAKGRTTAAPGLAQVVGLE